MGDLTATTVHVYECIGGVLSHALSSANFITASMLAHVHICSVPKLTVAA